MPTTYSNTGSQPVLAPGKNCILVSLKTDGRAAYRLSVQQISFHSHVTPASMAKVENQNHDIWNQHLQVPYSGIW